MATKDDFLGTIVGADFEPEDHIIVNIRAPRETRIGHWPVRVERTTGPFTVTWADAAIEQALQHLIEWQRGDSLVLNDSTTVAVAIDCLRAVLGQEALV